MDNELQALLTVLSLLAVIVELNSAFHQAATAYMLRRKEIIQRTVTVPFFWVRVLKLLIV